MAHLQCKSVGCISFKKSYSLGVSFHLFLSLIFFSTWCFFPFPLCLDTRDCEFHTSITEGFFSCTLGTLRFSFLLIHFLNYKQLTKCQIVNNLNEIWWYICFFFLSEKKTIVRNRGTVEWKMACKVVLLLFVCFPDLVQLLLSRTSAFKIQLKKVLALKTFISSVKTLCVIY